MSDWSKRELSAAQASALGQNVQNNNCYTSTYDNIIIPLLLPKLSQVNYASLDAYAGVWAVARIHTLLCERDPAGTPAFFDWLSQEADAQV